MDVRKKAEKLAAAILNSAEYKKMIAARENINNHKAAQVMLRDFQDKQEELHKQQMEGQTVTPEQEQQLEQLFAVISVNPYIRELFEAEFAFSGLMMDVNDVLSKALDLKDEEPGTPGNLPKFKYLRKKS